MSVVEKIRKEILNKANPDFKPVWFKTGKGEYSEHDKFLGVTVPELRLIAKKFSDCSLDDLKDFISSPYNEERFFALVACINIYEKAPSIQKRKVFEFFTKNIVYVNNWNLVDLSAHKILGRYIYEGFADVKLLHKMSGSKNMWERRIAIVATWYFIHNNITSHSFDLAYKLLHDEEDLMHKATGWMLREAGKKDLKSLKIFLDANVKQMPRTMLRYAIERMSDKDKKRYMSM